MILYIENPKDSTQKLLELINEFGKVAGYKIDLQKLVAFLYITMKYKKGKVKKISFKITLKINLTKEVKDLRAENYKTLIKEIEDE